MKDRIKIIFESSGLSQQDFAGKLEIAPATISGIFNGRTQPTNKTVQAIHKSFPEINVNWLLFGEGEMYNSSQPSLQPLATPSYDDFDETPLPSVGNDLFSMMTTEPATPAVEKPKTVKSTPRASHQPTQNVVQIAAKNTDNANRKIKEIRVFYEDQTYEVFVPAK